MPQIIPGAESSSSLVQLNCDTSIPNSELTVFAAAFRFIHRGPVAWEDSVGVKIANSELNHNAGMGLTTSGVSNSLYLNIRLRSAKKNAYSHMEQITAGAVNNFAIRADFINQVVHFIVNGVTIDPPTPMEEDDTWSSASLQPFIRSQVGLEKDTEWHELAFWTNAGDSAPENVDSHIPTLSQLEALTAGGLFEDVPTPMKSWIKPVGTDGAYAGSVPDLALTGAVWSQTTGDTEGPFAPYFVGPPAEVDVDAEATARTLNIEGTTSVSGGTVYVIVDTVANMPTPPDPEDVAGGFLADGVTAALDSTSQAMTGTTNLSVAFEPLPANTNLAYALVHDKDGEGDYSEVTYGTISTKRPVVVPAGEDPKWYKADGTERVNETGVVLTLLGTEYSESGLTTDANAEGEVDLTAYINGGGDLDVGDAVDFDLTFSDGEVLAARGLTITEGV